MNDAVYVSLNDLARRTGLPRGWLRAEALAGRLPNLRVGRRLVFDYRAVLTALASRHGQEGHFGGTGSTASPRHDPPEHTGGSP